jgi:hypothetical protein
MSDRNSDRAAKVKVEDAEAKTELAIEMSSKLMPKAQSKRLRKSQRRLELAQKGGFKQ